MSDNSHVLKFIDIQNLEFRKGSLEYGDKIKQLIEFLRIYKNENDDSLTFGKDDFESLSNMTIDEINRINNLPTIKSLIDFDIEISNNQIKFINLQNKRSLHYESFNPSIRTNYEIMGVDDFYKNVGGEYKNPHLGDIKKCMEKVISFGYDELNDVLDLASGTGEITNILTDMGYDAVMGCDPYLYREYELNTGKKCLRYSFNDIQQNALSYMKFDTIICSYGLHLADKSILPDLFWNLSQISKTLVIISPNNNPVVKEDYGWTLEKEFKDGKSKCKIYELHTN